eukprot:CAMPEP_0178750534 /NCGR_PEP_ID=MMETSP0744-20121128/10050_1 /TAXON_ID=913974 /ORGANISM="Nitzschia punctata, Strain CCMP561" /LENGTH=449 /DNA_ID=CAMNT_0020404131 /DNA_START=260 /DNA_END=1609 /DNA_ORIENTATION=-
MAEEKQEPPSPSGSEEGPWRPVVTFDTLNDGDDPTSSQSFSTSGISVRSVAVRKSVISKFKARRSSVVGGDRAVTASDITNIFTASDPELPHVIDDKQIDRVRAMHNRFSEGAESNFNFNTLLLVASVLAGLGLISNSSTTIIASMLVSPIMGPVMGMAYGMYIGDKKMTRKALKTELLSLVFCVFIGIIIGLVTGWTSLAQKWPTQEMLARGYWQSLLVGLPVAFFSGLGVAVSLLDDQTSSLVGVAISASLLPPAVNAGLLWISYIYYKNDVLSGENVIGLHNGEYHVYDEVSPKELRILQGQFLQAGTISLLLTLSNVVLIIISSMFMFRLKERLPVKKKIAWQDLGVARKIFSDRAVMMTPTEGASTDLELSMDNSSLFMIRNNSVSTPPPMMALPRMDEIKECKEEECCVTIAGDNNKEETAAALDLEEGRRRNSNRRIETMPL